MQGLGEHFYRPGLVSAVVTIYHHRNEIEKAGNVLRDAVEYYRKSGVTFQLIVFKHCSKIYLFNL
jgi:hypothetical protein